MRERSIYLISAVATIFLGLASRKYRQQLPQFVGEYSGDTLWALMMFLIVSFLLAGRPLLQRCSIAMILSFAVEVSQLYHAPWIDNIRSTTLGRLVLGFGFLWSDLVCYTVGIVFGAAIERCLRRYWRREAIDSVQ